MDTRGKIVSLASLPQLLAEGSWTVVAGTFDPLTLTDAERLVLLGQNGTLLAIVDPSRDCLLSPEARAALLAALRHVSLVTIASRTEWQPVLDSLPAIQVHEDQAADRTRFSAFVAHILTRQQAGR